MAEKSYIERKIELKLKAAISSSLLPVMFRVDTKGQFKGDITAIFPTESNSFDNNECVVYVHDGQHGVGDLDIVTNPSTTRLATPQEYQPLLDELRGIYDNVELQVITEITSEMNQTRIEQATKYRNMR